MAEPKTKEEFHSRGTRGSKLADSVARKVITAGGVLIIVSVIGIIAFILMEAFPLTGGANIRFVSELDALEGDMQPLAAGTEEYRDVLYAVHATGKISFHSLPEGEKRDVVEIESAASNLTAASLSMNGGLVSWGDEEGRVGMTQARFKTDFLPGGGRKITTSVRERAVFEPSSSPHKVEEIVGGRDDDGIVSLLSLHEDGALLLSVWDPDEEEEEVLRLDRSLTAPATTLAIAQDGSLLAVGTEAGEVAIWDNVPGMGPRLLEITRLAANDGASISALRWLIGSQSLVVGSDDGELAVWSRVPRVIDGQRDWGLQKIHQFPHQPSAVIAIAASPRDKGFLTVGAAGELRLHYSTSERTLGEFRTNGNPIGVFLSPRADGALAIGGEKDVTLWHVENPHPEVSWRTLFGKVWYEGLPEPAWVWQSTGGSDDFEPKLSLVPLIFGTMKGAIYAMIFSLPIAVLGAIYTSQFASNRIKNLVKPFVEVLAALPSVIIGFLAGLWLAPMLLKILPGAILMLGVVPLTVIAAVFLFEFLPRNIRLRFSKGAELWLIMGLTLVSAYLSLKLGPFVERMMFGGDMTQSIQQNFGLIYDQRNCVVVGFALGFAVIPIIFTIAEDALSSVPRHLVSASLALGANRWTTTWRIVVPTASAGVFAAIMLGFGRAVGETMIVLMATGNTPIMDWNIFNGMRTLSANIAVEIPEAPIGGTLYRILFLSGALLFVMTFLTNSVAEMVGHRLRKKYQRL